MKKVALCIHDLRVSEGRKIMETILNIREFIKFTPITIHLVFDRDLDEKEETFLFLKKEVELKRLEIVFHGVIHQCPVGTGKLSAWYHKYQAEFIGNAFDVDMNRNRYHILNNLFNLKTGICPPCWIASDIGWKFLKDLSPLYIERLCSIQYEGNQFYTLPVSLGSNKEKELLLLRKLATILTYTATLFNHKRLRLVIHTIDLLNLKSMSFFRKNFYKLIAKGYFPVLQRDLA